MQAAGHGHGRGDVVVGEISDASLLVEVEDVLQSLVAGVGVLERGEAELRFGVFLEPVLVHQEFHEHARFRLFYGSGTV